MTYVGSFQNDKLEGYGHYTTKSTECIGEFMQDTLTGHGILKTEEFTLQGQFKQWKLNGFGEIRYSESGNRWSGEWIKGPVGLGVLTY